MVYTFEISMGVVVALVASVTHLASNTGLSTKLCPWLALVLGVAGAFVLSGFSVVSVIYGLVMGFMSYGAWNMVLDASGKQV